MKIIQSPLPDNQYYKVAQPKKIIVLHHTVSGSVSGSLNWWKTTSERVATAYIIDRNGDIHQTFDDKFWAHHLGITTAQLKKYGSTVSNERLNQISVGLELDSWGGLTQKNGKWINAGGKEMPIEKVEVLDKPFRGFKAFEKYTKEQIASVKELLLMLNKKYGISLKYRPEMWDASREALVGTHGVFAHVSYRSDKSDVFPSQDLIAMLKTIA